MMSTEKQAVQLVNLLFTHSLDLEEYLGFSAVQGINMRVEGKTVLHQAVLHNDHKLFEEILDRADTNVNQVDADGATAWRYVLRKRRDKMFGRLLADPRLEPDVDVIPIPLDNQGYAKYFADEGYYYREQPTELDLGRRGSLAMVKQWHQQHPNLETTGRVNLGCDSVTSEVRHATNLSILDMAIIHNNQPVLKYLLQETELLPQAVTVTASLHPKWYDDGNGQHPAGVLIKALGNPDYERQWKEIVKEGTMAAEDAASMINAWLTKIQMERILPVEGGQVQSRGPRTRVRL